MTKLTTFLAGLFCIAFLSGHSLNAPVTKAHSVTNPQIGAVIKIPVTVSSFWDIGSFSLVLDYDPVVLTYVSNQPNAALTNFLLDDNPVLGRIIISYYELYGITMSDGANLVDINFEYHGGATALTWFVNDGSCEYAKFDDGLYTILNDLPHTHFYINGEVSDNVAPVTYAPVLTGVAAGPLALPIMVTGFTEIGTISLTLEYSSDVLVYQNSFTGNPTLTSSGSWLVGTQNGPGLKKYLVISWLQNESPPPVPLVSLPDSSVLITVMFNYPDHLKSTELTWIDNDATCEYSDGSYNILTDDPTSDFYIDGFISGSRQGPVTTAPTTSAVPGTNVVIPVSVQNFTDINSFSLALDYDSTVLTFQSISNGSLPGTWTLNGTATVPGRLILTGSGPAATLAGNSSLLNAVFQYHGGGSLLTWYDEDFSSCQYIDGSTLLALNDRPIADHYINGSIGPAPVLSAKIFLQGPYDPVATQMSTTLNVQGILPIVHPFAGVPWNYGGDENVPVMPVSITDWVLVELRTDPASASTIGRKAGFVTNEGMITGLDGISPLVISGIGPGYYYIVVHHRNHLSVMSSSAQTVNRNPHLYDFTTGTDKYFGGAAGAILIDQTLSRWGMIGGDANCDGSIYINDYTDYWVPHFGEIQGYSPGDFNLDGNVYINDNTDYWVSNFGLNNVLP